jgi:hypothetical protein
MTVTGFSLVMGPEGEVGAWHVLAKSDQQLRDATPGNEIFESMNQPDADNPRCTVIFERRDVVDSVIRQLTEMRDMVWPEGGKQ